METCGASDCFIKNNWFGASPNHPGNKENYRKCRFCHDSKLTKVLNVRALITKLDWKAP